MYVDPKIIETLNDATIRIKYPKNGDLLISEEGVMQSPAGYYVGSMCAEYDKAYGWLKMPYDRYTNYFETLEEAERALNTIEE